MYWQADAAAASGAGGAAKKVERSGRRRQCAEPNRLSLVEFVVGSSCS